MKGTRVHAHPQASDMSEVHPTLAALAAQAGRHLEPRVVLDGQGPGPGVVWQVGHQPVLPLAEGWPTGDPVVTIGGAGTAEHGTWGPFQLGPLHGGVHFQEATKEIRFTLTEVAPCYELRLDLYHAWGPCPHVEVAVNGWRCLVSVDPWRVDYRHILPIPCPISGDDNVVLAVPAHALVAGENVVRLTTKAVGTPVSAEERAALLHPVGTGTTFMYWGVTLCELAAAPAAPPQVDVVPLPLYLEDGGGLVELVDLRVRVAEPFSAGHAILEIGPHRMETDLSLHGYDAGDVEVRLRVPELAGATTARVVLDLDGSATTHETTVVPCRKWTLHVMPHVHLDLGFTDFQGKVAEIHARNLERATRLIEATPGYAFNVDGSFGVEQYLDTRDLEAAGPVLDALRSGRIGVNAFYALLLTGLPSLEELYRALYFSADLHRRHGVPFDYGNVTDVPSYTWALPSALSAAGIDALMAVPNHMIMRTDDAELRHLLSPCRWEGPDGAQVMAFFADCYSQFPMLCGDPPTIAGGESSLPLFVRRYERPDYGPSDLPVFGTHGDNEDLGKGKIGGFVERWNATYAHPHLRFSTIADYFDAVRPSKDSLPLLRGDGGSYWESAVGIMARTVATYRSAQAALPVAETLYALAGLGDRRLSAPRDRLARGWRSLVIASEHTWGSKSLGALPASEEVLDQQRWQIEHVDGALRVAKDETHQAMGQLAEQIETPLQALLVVNPLPWPRSTEVEVELGPGEVLVDGDRPVPMDVLDLEGVHRATFRVEGLEPFGYKVLGRRPGSAARGTVTKPVPGTFEVGPYVVGFDAARGVTSLRHRGLDREVLDAASPHGLGEVVTSTGGTRAHVDGRELPTKLALPDWFLPEGDPDVSGATLQDAVLVSTPLGARLEIDSSAPHAPEIRTSIRLHDAHDRVDVVVRMRRQGTEPTEAVYIAFPFAPRSPAVRYDRQQGWVDPASDHQPGAANEWFTALYGASVAGDGLCVAWTPLDAPLFTVGTVVQGTWARTFAPANGTIFSWVMRWTTLTAVQDGDHVFRYSFTPMAAWDPGRAARLGREARTPPATARIEVTDKTDGEPRPLPAAGGPLFGVDLPDGLVATMHPAVDGRGVMVRVQDMTGQGGRARLAHPGGGGGAAFACSAVEDDLRPLDVVDGHVDVDVPPWSVTTVRLMEGGG